MCPSGERKGHRLAAPLYKPHGSNHQKKVVANSPKNMVICTLNASACYNSDLNLFLVTSSVLCFHKFYV